MYWFLYDNSLRHERVKSLSKHLFRLSCNVSNLALTMLTGKSCVLFSLVQEWPLGWFWTFSYVYTNNLVPCIPLLRIKEYKMFENVIHPVDNKNKWLLLSASFTAKFGLVFVLTLENAFFRGFILKLTERAYVLLKNCTRDFKIALPLKDRHIFM